MLPSLTELELVRKKIKNIPNRQGEYKRKVHHGCYLLCSESGLRISEAIKFDLTKKDKNGLYRINKPKGKKERFIYVPKETINELKANNWQPNQTNRFTFYWFLRKIKRELNISKNTELTPHTLRRSFTTYHAETGMPLTLLQKWLGHESKRTTILYWRNIYEKPFAGKIPVGDNDIADILAAKKWLEDKKEPPKLPTAENFPQIPKNPEPIFLNKKPATSNQKPIQQDNSLLTAEIKQKPLITNYQPKLIVGEINQQLPTITNKGEQPNEKEQILLTKIKNLEEQLTQIQAERQNLNEILKKSESENKHLKAENKHLKALIQQFPETETKIIQPLPNK